MPARKAQWDNEKVDVERVQKIREEIEQVNKEIEKAQHYLRSRKSGRASVWQAATASKAAGGRGREGEESGKGNYLWYMRA